MSTPCSCSKVSLCLSIRVVVTIVKGNMSRPAMIAIASSSTPIHTGTFMATFVGSWLADKARHSTAGMKRTRKNPAHAAVHRKALHNHRGHSTLLLLPLS